jgi:hypothetical protein
MVSRAEISVLQSSAEDADTVETLFYGGEPVVDYWLVLSIGENVGPVAFDAFPNQFADLEWIDTLGYPFAQRFDMFGDWSFRRPVFTNAR